MQKLLLSAIATCGMLSNTTYAQLDLGGAVGAGVNQAAAATQGAGALGSGINAGLNSGAAVNQAAGAAQGTGALGAGTTGGFNAGTQIGSQFGSQLGSQIGGSTGSQLGAQAGAAFGSQLGAQAGTQLGSQLGAPTLGAQAGTQAGAQLGTQTGIRQGWLGGLSNDFRSALQPGTGNNLVFQDNLNPALQQYGFRPGDQVIGLNGQPLQASQLDAYLQQNPNQVRVLRNGQTIVLDTNRQMSGMMAQGGMHGGFQSGRPRLGITMNPSQNAVIVASVAQGSPAQMAGIRPGDQILSVNGRPVANPNAMIQAVGQASASESLAVQLRRNGQVIQSQVMLTDSGAGHYRAGYGQPGFGQGMAQGDLNERINQLERMLQDLRNEIRQLGPAGAQGTVGASDNFGASGDIGATTSAAGSASLDVNAADDNNQPRDNQSNDNQSNDRAPDSNQSNDSAKP